MTGSCIRRPLRISSLNQRTLMRLVPGLGIEYGYYHVDINLIYLV